MSDHPLVLGTAGHIDHGKTALVEALTGTNTDRLDEERRRGMTIELGFAALDLGERTIGIVDVPGHERFVRTMLAGATGIDLGLLVVAADDGVMPQTREHAAILDLLGLRAGVVAISKVDRVDEARRAAVRDEVRALLAGTGLDGCAMVETSVVDGRGLEELRSRLAGAADAVCATDRFERRFRLSVDRSFAVRGVGTVVTGTVRAGTVGPGDLVEAMPTGVRASVRAVERHGEPAERLVAGGRGAIVLPGVGADTIGRGIEFAAPGLLRPGERLTAWIRVLDGATGPLGHRTALRLHLGTAAVPARVHLLGGVAIEPGETGLVQLVLERPVACAWGDPLVLRLNGPVTTIGGGRVLQPVAAPLPRRRPDLLDRLEALRAGNEDERAEAAIELGRLTDWEAGDLDREAGVRPVHAASIVDRLVERGTVHRLGGGPRGDRLVHDRSARELTGRLRAVLERLHGARPAEPAVPRSKLVAAVDRMEPAVAEALVDHGAETGAFIADRRTVRLAGLGPTLDEHESRLLETVLDRCRRAAFRPPSVEELAAEFDVRAAVLEPLVAIAVDDGRLVRVGEGRLLDRDAFGTIASRLRAAGADDGGLTLSELRVCLETTRKYAVPIAEHLDRIRVTRRIGDRRVLVV